MQTQIEIIKLTIADLEKEISEGWSIEQNTQELEHWNELLLELI